MSDFGEIVTIIHAIQDRDILEDFLLGITTPKERAEFAQRLEIIKGLIAGVPQTRLAKDLGVGIATVTRGSKELAQGRFKILRAERHE
ncbi:MAG TPA: Trp family transcriptional regulator [Candidatus Saccharimonadales bacterium]|nr:Trp family transcriptional regulator [Candidatus Saccharimonadales bacterium]